MSPRPRLVAATALSLACGACGGSSSTISPVGDADPARDVTDAADAVATVGYAPRWAFGAGDGAGQLGDAIAIEDGGDVIIGGELGGGMDLGPGVTVRASDGAVASGFVAKLDGSGHARWAVRFGGAKGGEQRVRAVAWSRELGIVVGGFFSGELECAGTVLASAGGSDAFLARLDEDGSVRACVRFGDAEHQAITAIALDPSGRIVIAGEHAGTIDLGGGPLVSAGGEDLFVATLDASFAHVWSRRFGDVDQDRLPRLARAASGELAIAGIYRGSIDLGGGPLRDRYDGGFVALLDREGRHVWSRGFDGDRHESPIAVAFTAARDVVVGGRFAGNVDFGAGKVTSASGEDAFVASWDALGAPRFSVRYGGDGEDSVNGLAIDGAGHLHVCGELTTSLDGLVAKGGPDLFVAELDDHGAMLFRAAFGDEGEQHAYRLALHDDAPVIIGSFFGAIDLGRAGRISSNGGFDPSAGDLFVVGFAR